MCSVKWTKLSLASVVFALASFLIGCQGIQPLPPTGGGSGGGGTGGGGTTPAPTASLTIDPATINAGQTATLTWQTTNATSVSIDGGIGVVAATGSMQITPSVTTTFHLTATGAGGTGDATALVTVN